MFLSVHVVFGHVISGQEVIQTIENQKTDANSRPYAEVKVLNCGELIPKSKGLFVKKTFIADKYILDLMDCSFYLQQRKLKKRECANLPVPAAPVIPKAHQIHPLNLKNQRRNQRRKRKRRPKNRKRKRRRKGSSILLTVAAAP